MLLHRAPVTAMLVLVIVAIAQFAHYLPLLPDEIAVHFGVRGGANGWSDTRAFAIVYGAVEAAIVATALLLARILERAPASSFNIPNRDYWFADARRRATLDFVTEQFLWIECLTLAFLVAIAQTVFKANLRGAPPTLPQDFWLSLAGFLVGVGWVSVRIVRRFSSPGPGGK